MSTQPPSQSRRAFLRGSLVTVPALGLFGSAAIAPGHAQEPARPAYAPRYFNADEWTFVQAAVDRLIPADDTGPGALESGVADFIDRQMDDAYGRGELWYMQGPFAPDAPATLGYQLRFTPRELYRAGIKAVGDWCQQQHGKGFAALAPEERDQVLQQLEHGAIVLEGVPAAAFFSQLLQNTKEGYFADPMYGGNKGMGSWKMIGFPGARADFADWIEQPGKVYPLGPVSIRGDKA